MLYLSKPRTYTFKEMSCSYKLYLLEDHYRCNGMSKCINHNAILNFHILQHACSSPHSFPFSPHLNVWKGKESWKMENATSISTLTLTHNILLCRSLLYTTTMDVDTPKDSQALVPRFLNMDDNSTKVYDVALLLS